ncbi:MAG: PstS family phosphate ABC transporter substrate-binding protein [candidate division WOR-3 bacterium]
MLLLVAGCGKKSSTATIKIDGSSTVYLIMEAAVEKFRKQFPGVKITVTFSGTGGGFKKFVRGEIEIANASRPIKETESEEAKKNGIEYIEIPIAYDALAVVVNPKNQWVDYFTVEELKKIWEPAATNRIPRCSQVRAGWPDKPLALFGAGVDSGTYDYFTAAIVGQEHASRGDYTSSEDDNVLVQGVAGDEGALGFFGVAYYEQNKERLKAVPIDDQNPKNGEGPILPTKENVLNGHYQPLSRPLFIYVSLKAAERAEVQEFVRFLLKNAPQIVEEVGYIPLSEQIYRLAEERFEKRITGSVFGSKGSQVGVKLENLYKMKTTGGM